MAGPNIDIRVYGDSSGVQRMLSILDTALNPIAIAGFLGAVVDPYLRKRARARFDSEGDSAVGGGWKPLAEATQTIRESLGYGAAHPINRREDDLLRYVTQEDGSTLIHPFGASLTLPGTAPVGKTGDKFKGAQQGGVTELGRPYPARPVLGMDESDLIFVLTALAGHIKKGGVV